MLSGGRTALGWGLGSPSYLGCFWRTQEGFRGISFMFWSCRGTFPGRSPCFYSSKYFSAWDLPGTVYVPVTENILVTKTRSICRSSVQRDSCGSGKCTGEMGAPSPPSTPAQESSGARCSKDGSGSREGVQALQPHVRAE